jgi:geranylgeranyl diphosphate synthase type II
MHSFQQLATDFEQYLVKNSPFPASPANLYDPCHYLMGIGGKRIRPVLCLMGNELFGELEPDAWRAAMGIELFHNFTLIHDDIMDKAPLRRGQQTIHEKYGQTAGILSGDVMAIYSYQQLSGIRVQLQPVLELFNKTAIEVCEGQQLDMDYETRNDVTIEEYVRMIELKTSVLLACALKTGALIGGATGGNADKVYAFGRNLGIAFQLQDDLLDAFGDPKKLGKQSGGDIKANKKTFLLIKALENASPVQRAAIEALIQSNDENKVTSMLQYFHETGAREECAATMKRYSDLAFECLEDIAVVSKRKAPLHELAAYLLQRQF